MGLRDFFRKHKNIIHKSSCDEKSQIHQQQHKENSNGIKPIELDAPA